MENQFRPKDEDRSLIYIGIVLGVIILIMGYLTFFVDDPSKIFTKERHLPTPIVVKNKTKPLNKSLEMSDEDERSSLIKFIDAFYYDQNRGYFDIFPLNTKHRHNGQRVFFISHSLIQLS